MTNQVKDFPGRSKRFTQRSRPKTSIVPHELDQENKLGQEEFLEKESFCIEIAPLTQELEASEGDQT